jgi:hypothetical protein
MFEALTARGRRQGEARAKARAAELAHRLADELPEGIACLARGDEVQLSGRALRRRFALDPALRSLAERLK